MIKLGIDFDNTLISYDYIFYKIALEQNLIDDNFPQSKKEIRDYLRYKNKEKSFTLLQGLVYGAKIIEAPQQKEMFSSLKKLKGKDIKIFIISHKTKAPYLGPKYDLHRAATQWLKKNSFFKKSGLNISLEDVFFELTMEKKVNRIEKLGCTHFIDDLPEILDMINPNIEKILYSPGDLIPKINKFKIMKNWSELENLLI